MSTTNNANILTCSDRCITVEFGSVIDPAVNAKVHALCKAVEAAAIAGVVELIPTYRSLGVCYNPLITSEAELKSRLAPIIANLGSSQGEQGRLVKIPVLYGGEFGPDLDDVAELNGLSRNEVIKLHSSVEYPIYMLGFLPGFCYLGGMDKRIAAPRLKTPRLAIAPGSVGIAGEQTGIYPIASPGGWRLIGRTPLKLYDPHRTTPILLNAGMRLKFVPIGEDEYNAIIRNEKGVEL